MSKSALARYEILGNLGDGSFGSVKKCRNKETDEIFALKVFRQKFKTWQEALELRELKSLKRLVHVNIIRLKEVIRENDELFMLFEFCEGNLHQLTKAIAADGRPPPEDAIRRIMFQVFSGLSHMHRHGYFHRDIKPENILFSAGAAFTPGPRPKSPAVPTAATPGGGTDTWAAAIRDRGEVPMIKLADFGLAREIRSRPPFTEYVSTRWYRAPELLLHMPNYNSPIDIWAAGCILAELFVARPLFPGASENDLLFRQASLLGTPKPAEWPEGTRVKLGPGGGPFTWPQSAGTPLAQVVTGASADALQVLSACLQWNPSRRPSADQCLSMRFFADLQQQATPAPMPAGGASRGSVDGSALSAVPSGGDGGGASPSDAPPRPRDDLLKKSLDDKGLDALLEELEATQQ
eukprot:TRINITY_DN2268_c0_g1_i2.p1 TRINITY_DN2268_c0_g1~~TRINITY_DN2268_c0_g1_i2.p1  ORF type:complete len:407 (+),score=62.58 TRINITY_DN2268_c0_g1_i2:61-1281(+)